MIPFASNNLNKDYWCNFILFFIINNNVSIINIIIIIKIHQI